MHAYIYIDVLIWICYGVQVLVIDAQISDIHSYTIVVSGTI